VNGPAVNGVWQRQSLIRLLYDAYRRQLIRQSCSVMGREVNSCLPLALEMVTVSPFARPVVALV